MSSGGTFLLPSFFRASTRVSLCSSALRERGFAKIVSGANFDLQRRAKKVGQMVVKFRQTRAEVTAKTTCDFAKNHVWCWHESRVASGIILREVGRKFTWRREKCQKFFLSDGLDFWEKYLTFLGELRVFRGAFRGVAAGHNPRCLPRSPIGPRAASLRRAVRGGRSRHGGADA